MSPGGFWNRSMTMRALQRSESHNIKSELLECWENTLTLRCTQTLLCTVIQRANAELKALSWASSMLVAEH